MSETDWDLAELVEPERLSAWAQDQREAGRTIVFTNGCFDLVHQGHVASLYEAARLGDVLLVAMNSDASVRALKGPSRPLLDEASRTLLLRGLRPVSAVTIFADRSVLATIRAVRPDVIAKGSEYDPRDVVGAEEIRSWGGRLQTLPMVPGVGTTSILEKFQRRLAGGDEPAEDLPR
jgi:D-beta-D-heptose 7-phosphate kinase/D-beta-D-heptose 1-phosphate adenosyltransferase